jgi:hypothetical protein
MKYGDNERLEKWIETSDKGESCLHDSCSRCHGTERKENGESCVHFISCRCKKCNPFTF